jgi:hypothetical protein
MIEKLPSILSSQIIILLIINRISLTKLIPSPILIEPKIPSMCLELLIIFKIQDSIDLLIIIISMIIIIIDI